MGSASVWAPLQHRCMVPSYGGWEADQGTSTVWGGLPSGFLTGPSLQSPPVEGELRVLSVAVAVVIRTQIPQLGIHTDS